MITVFIKYRQWVNGDVTHGTTGTNIEKSKILEIRKLTDLNDDYENRLIDIKVLKDET